MVAGNLKPSLKASRRAIPSRTDKTIRIASIAAATSADRGR
jgi:hypothetical protein